MIVAGKIGNTIKVFAVTNGIDTFAPILKGKRKQYDDYFCNGQ